MDPEREPAPLLSVVGFVVEGPVAPVSDPVLLTPVLEPEPPVVAGLSEAVPDGVVTEVEKVDVSSEIWESGAASLAPGLPSPISGALVLVEVASLLLDAP